MHISDFIKTAATTIDGLIAIGSFVGSVYYAKDKKDCGTMIALLAISGLFIANAVVMWV